MDREVLENSFVEQHYTQAQNINPHKKQKDDPKYEEKIKLIEECQEIVGTDDSKKKPLNIAIIGLPGGGKSSLLNTVFASFSTKCWEDIVQFGSFGTLDRQFTTRFKRFAYSYYFYVVKTFEI